MCVKVVPNVEKAEDQEAEDEAEEESGGHQLHGIQPHHEVLQFTGIQTVSGM